MDSIRSSAPFAPGHGPRPHGAATAERFARPPVSTPGTTVLL